MINVKYIPCLFEDRTYEFKTHNLTIRAILISLLTKYPELREEDGGIQVRVNGKIYPIWTWLNELKDGDRVYIIQEIGFGTEIPLLGITIGTLITIIQITLLVCSIAYTIYSICTAPSTPKTGQGLNDSPTYGWDGLQMQIRQGVPVPVVYGEHLVGGNLIEAYITSDADKNYLNLLIALSEGEIEGIMKEDLSTVCTSAHNIFASGTITMAGTATEGGTFTVDLTTFTWKETPEGSDIWGKSVECAIGISADEACANIITIINTNVSTVKATRGAGNTVIVTAVSPGAVGNNIVFSETSSNMSMNGAGHLGSTTWGVDGDHPYILINDNPLSNFTGIEWDYRLGTQDQTQIPGFGDICQTYSLGNPMITSTPYVYTTVDSDVEAFDLRFRIPGLYIQWKGNYYAKTSVSHIEHKLHSASTWTDDGQFTIIACSQDAVRRYFRIDNLTPGQYDIRITLLDGGTNTNGPGDLYLDNVCEIKYDTLTYPLTALIAVKILATGNLGDSMPNVLTRIRGIKTKNLEYPTNPKAWTDNPIYNVNDLMTNSRYGTGRYITQSHINNDQLIVESTHCDEMLGDGTFHVSDSASAGALIDSDYTFVTTDIGRYLCCKSPTDTTVYTTLLISSLTNDNHTAHGTAWSAGTPSDLNWEFGEHRYNLDLVLDSSQAAFECINQICGSFRGTPIWNKDAIQIFIEKKENPSYIFNMGNIIEGSFKHTFGSEKSKSNDIQIDYADRDKRFQKETVEVIDYATITGGVPMRTRQLSLIGSTRQSQNYREARFHLNAAQKQDEQIAFRGSIDSIHLLPMDVTKFQHDVFKWGQGGRIASAGIDWVQLDQTVVLSAGSTYALTVKLSGDTLETLAVSTPATAGTNLLTVSSNYSSVPPVYSLYAVGLSGVETEPFRIMAVSKTPENEIEVVATKYDETVYKDTDIVLAQPVFSTLPPITQIPNLPNVPDPSSPPPDVTNFVVVETTDKTGVSISFTQPSTGTNWAKATIYKSTDGGSTYKSLTTMYNGGPFIDHDMTAGLTYYFKVISLSLYDVESASPPTTHLTMSGTTPVAPTALTATTTFYGIVLNWTIPAHTEPLLTEIWRADNVNNRASATLRASVYGTSYTDKTAGWLDDYYYYYWVRNKNENGQYSTWYPVAAT